MHELPILKDIVILLAASILTSVIFHRLKAPSIVGFILGGMIIGPYGIALIPEKEMIDVMAEIGIVLLLFTIGIEFSLAELGKIGKRGLAAAIAQVVVTVAVAAGLSGLLGISAMESLFLGFVIALSSTVIVLRLFMERGEIDSMQGRLSLGTLLTQDMAIVPMVLFVQIFGKGASPSIAEVGETLGLAVLALAAVIVTAYYVVPLFLSHIVKLRSPEVFTMAGIFICLGTAWVSASFGLSLAIGAFIAGIVISESEYSHQITASILPFRDIFNSIFFISIGMLIRLDSLVVQLLPVVALTAAIILFKTLIISLIYTIMRYPLRIAFTVGLSLAQIGEFSFVLLKMGSDEELVSEAMYQLFLPSIVLSMIITPLLVKMAPVLSSKLPDLIPGRGDGLQGVDTGASSVINHVIIAGYGLMGKHLATVLKKTGISYVVVDLNHENVKKSKEDGHITIYGDISYREVLKSVGASAAKVMVFAISDPVGTRRGIKIAKEVNPGLHVIVRTKYMGEITGLSELGADQVIPEEFETSVEIFSRVLREYKVPGNIIQNQIDLIRMEGYAMLRGSSIQMEKMTEISRLLAASVSETFYVEEGSPADKRSIRDLDLRRKSGTSIIAVARGEKTQTNPSPDYVIESGDILVLLSSHAEIAAAMDVLKGIEGKSL